MIRRPDLEAYRDYPWFRPWYHKPLLYDRFCVHYGLFPELPKLWPVIAKPVINFEGVGKGLRLCRSKDELEALPGFLWMPLCKGPQLSVDIRIGGTCHVTRGHVKEPGVFDFWERIPSSEDLERRCRLIRNVLDPYLRIPVINLEFIGETLVEVHARAAEEFDLLKPGIICVPVWARVERHIVLNCDDPITNVLTEMGSLTTFRSTLEDGWPDIGPHGWYRYGLLYGRKLDRLREITRRLRVCIENMETTE